MKALNRAMIDAGLIAMRDSPNGKRYGRRNPKDGRIIEAYGFDLSPLAARYAEFVRLAEQAKAERAEMGRLRRRATIARNGITQILETATEYGFTGAEWNTLTRDSRNLTGALRTLERLEEMALGVESLERRQRQARERLETLLATVGTRSSNIVQSDPKGTENGPHQYTYKPNLNPKQDTVFASKESKRGSERDFSNPEIPGQPEVGKGGRQAPAVRDDRGTVMRLGTDELIRLAPGLRSYLRNAAPTWREIVDAADWLRHDLGVSKSLWGEACVAMGREEAAIALAIVSAKPVSYFRTSPGSYFHGMVAKAKSGDLNLTSTIWGLRQAKAPKLRPRLTQ